MAYALKGLCTEGTKINSFDVFYKLIRNHRHHPLPKEVLCKIWVWHDGEKTGHYKYINVYKCMDIMSMILKTLAL